MSLVPYGNVSGVVTDTSANDLANICVYLYPVGGSSSAAASCTLANGSYFISGVAPGSYDVAFADTYATGVYSTQWYTGATGGAATQSGATAVTVPAGGQTLSGVGAAMSLVPYGNVSGVVTDTSSNDLANICVYLYPVGGSAPTAASCTLANGSYEFYGLTAGTQYDVAFYDPNYVYTTQWYNGAATQAGATAVTVPAGGQTLSGIGAAMAG
jgi:phage gp45-like